MGFARQQLARQEHLKSGRRLNPRSRTVNHFQDSPLWCNVVNKGKWPGRMKAKKTDSRKAKAQSAATVRATISFPHDLYETLETIAKEKKVSLAWVVREASEKYIAEKWPLFARS